MGGSGRTAFKHGADCPCTSGEFPSGKRLGAVYGCNHTGSQCTGPANRIYVVGKTGTEQDTDADKSEASDFKSATSKPTFCIQRFLDADISVRQMIFLKANGIEPIDWQIENL